jgi:hypothetical protein
VQDFPFDAEHGLKALLAAKEELASSSFYSEMRTLLLASVADSPVTCLYCFGLGRLASPVTRHQAALLLLLKENFKICFSYSYGTASALIFCLSRFVQHGFGFY